MTNWTKVEPGCAMPEIGETVEVDYRERGIKTFNDAEFYGEYGWRVEWRDYASLEPTDKIYAWRPMK
jgi:hypothetical protein